MIRALRITLSHRPGGRDRGGLNHPDQFQRKPLLDLSVEEWSAAVWGKA